MKVVFFREEETGCKGSSEAVMSFFDDVRFVIQPDRKGNSDPVSYTHLDVYKRQKLVIFSKYME